MGLDSGCDVAFEVVRFAFGSTVTVVASAHCSMMVRLGARALSVTAVALSVLLLHVWCCVRACVGASQPPWTVL